MKRKLILDICSFVFLTLTQTSQYQRLKQNYKEKIYAALSHIPSDTELDSMKESRLELEEHFSDGIPHSVFINMEKLIQHMQV